MKSMRFGLSISKYYGDYLVFRYFVKFPFVFRSFERRGLYGNKGSRIGENRRGEGRFERVRLCADQID